MRSPAQRVRLPIAMALVLLLRPATIQADSLWDAVQRGDAGAVRTLLDAGAAVNEPNADGFTPLLLAAFEGHEEAARILVAKGADVNARVSVSVASLNREGIEIGDRRTEVSATPLVAAAFRGHRGMVELLLEAGADVNLEAADHTTPLGAALNAGQEEIARYLLAHDADIDALRLDDREGSKVLPGMLYADLPRKTECEWEAGQPTAPPSSPAFPASGQTTSYPAITHASGGTPIAVADDGAVRAGTPARFVDNRNGTIIDGNTGLMWEKKCGAGGGLHDYRRVYSWSDPSRDATVWGWIAAVNRERGTGFAGHDDWRIPNVKELQSIADYERYGPSVSVAFGVEDCRGCLNLRSPDCSCTAPSFYWTSTTFADFIAHAFVVGFGSGLIDDAVKSQRLFVRAVRGGL
jgi:hypothetical protein